MLTIEQLLSLQNHCWQAGRQITVEELLKEHSTEPTLLAKDDLLQLICNEVWHREQENQQPQLSDYIHRFPYLSKELETQWSIDELLAPRLKNGLPSVEKMPERIGRYDILGELGSGAAGIVYEGFDGRLNRSLAIKCLHARTSRDANELQRFQREAESFGRLNHPNILTVYDVGIEKGALFIVTEYCPAGTLADLIASKPLPANQAAVFASQIASGVAAAHCASIIHRDIKPANVLMSYGPNGHMLCKVSDFGLAKWIDSDVSATIAGSIVGSPAYMAPEQARGQQKLVGKEADVYSIGAVLFQMLTGRPPFLGSSFADTLYQIERSEPLLVRQLSPNTPVDLETIVSKCLRKEPTQRYSTAQELFDELQRYLRGESILARPEQLHHRLIRSAKRNPLTATLVSLSVLLMVSITIGSLWFSSELNQALRVSQQSEHQAKLEKADALLEQASGRRMRGTAGRRLLAQQSLQEAVKIGHELNQPTEWFDKFRNEATETLWLSDLAITKWKEAGIQILSAAISPDEQTIAILGHDHELQIRELVSDRLLAKSSLEPGGYIRFLKANQILYLVPTGVTLFQRDGADIVKRWSFRGNSIANMWFEPKSPVLACELDDKIVFLDINTGESKSETPKGQFYRPHIAINPVHSLYLICSYHSRSAELRDLRTHASLWRHQGADGAPHSSAWTADGHEFVLLFGDTSKNMQIHSLDGRLQPSLTKTLNLHLGGGLNGFWTANKHLVLGNWDNFIYLCDSVFEKKNVQVGGHSILWHDLMFGQSIDKGRRQIAVAIASKLSSKKYGLLSIAFGEEAQKLIGAESQMVSGTCVVNDRDLWLMAIVSEAEKRILLVVDLSHGRLHKLELPGLALWRIILDRKDVHLFSPEFSMRLRWTLSDNKLRLSRAQRSAVLPSYGEVSISPDGKSIVSGLWNGYSDSPYCGVWVKNKDEPSQRRLIGFESGKFNSIHQDSESAIFSFNDACYRYDLQSNRTSKIGTSRYYDPIEINKSGDLAIAGDRLWDTRDWTEYVLTDMRLADSHAVRFSNDGQQVICVNQEGLSQMADLDSGKLYLQFEGELLFYDSVHGKLIVRNADGVSLRHLDQVVPKLEELGVPWTGPKFTQTPSPKFENVELSDDLASLASYSQWMDHIDRETLKDAASNQDDGEALFQAAIVRLEQFRLDQAAQLLSESARLLPKSSMTHYWLAYIHAACGRWQSAVDEVSPWIEKTNDSMMRLVRACWYLELGQPDLAIADADAAEKANAFTERRCLAIRALAYRELGDEEREKEYLKKWQANRPSDNQLANAIFPMVAHDLSLRHIRLAQFYLEQMSAFDNTEVAIARGWIMLRSDRYSDAIESVRPLLQDESGEYTCSALLVCAMSEARQGNQKAAMEHLEKAKLFHANPKHSAYGSREIRLLIAEAEVILSESKRSLQE